MRSNNMSRRAAKLKYLITSKFAIALRKEHCVNCIVNFLQEANTNRLALNLTLVNNLTNSINARRDYFLVRYSEFFLCHHSETCDNGTQQLQQACWTETHNSIVQLKPTVCSVLSVFHLRNPCACSVSCPTRPCRD